MTPRPVFFRKLSNHLLNILALGSICVALGGMGWILYTVIQKGAPVLSWEFLTARSELETRLESLRLGADDYICKPFSSKELVLRMRNILSRANNGSARLLIQHGPICLDKISLHASLAGKALELTTAEFKLLSYLMERPGKVQDRYELQHVILGHSDTTQTRALDTHIKRLRHKLGLHAGFISTERGIGYYFDPNQG